VDKLTKTLNNILHVHDPSVFLEIKKTEENGIHLEVIYTNIDTIIGFAEIKKILNKHLKLSNLTIISIGLKK